jgi:hypothetical protein
MTSISDEGLPHLLALNGLQILSLHHTRVTDQSVEYLAQLKSLRSLDIKWTYLTLDGVLKLRAALPGCEIRD